MGSTLSKCWGGGGKKPGQSSVKYQSLRKDGGDEPSPRTLSSGTDHVTEHLEPPNKRGGDHEPGETSFSARAGESSEYSARKGTGSEEHATKPSPINAVTEDRFVTETFESVYRTTLELFDLNHGTLGNVQELTRELSDNPELVSFIQDYLKASIETIDLFSFLEDCLLKAQSTVDLARKAVYLFEKGASAGAVVRALDRLVAQGKTFQPFPKSKEVELQRLCEHHHSRIKKLSERKKVLDEKLANIECWKTVTSYIGLVGIGVLLIGSTVLAIMTGPGVALTVLGLASGAIPMVLDKVINPFFDKRKSPLEGERDTIVELRKQTSIAIHELNSINALVKEFEECVNSLNWYARFPTEGGHNEEKEDKVIMAMYDVKAKAKRLKKEVNNMKKEVRKRREKLRTAVATVLMAVKNNKHERVSCVKCL